MNLFIKEKQTLSLGEGIYGCQGGRLKERGRELGIDTYTLLYLKWITNKDLCTHSTGNSAQCHVAAWMEGEFGRGWI